MTLSETLMLIATSLAALAAIVSGIVAWRQHVWNKKTTSRALDLIFATSSIEASPRPGSHFVS